MIRYALPFLLALAAVPALADNSDMDIDKVNGSIRVPDNATAETVNGGVDVDRDSTLISIETVNGGVQVGDKVKVEKTVETVNGGITLQPGADVAGKVSNVNGGMRINGAHVGGGLETTSGDIDIGANSRVEGGLLVNEDRSWFHSSSSRKPRITIGPYATVQGNLTFKREVDLYVSESATIGPVQGATPNKFSGDHPN